MEDDGCPYIRMVSSQADVRFVGTAVALAALLSAICCTRSVLLRLLHRAATGTVVAHLEAHTAIFDAGRLARAAFAGPTKAGDDIGEDARWICS